MQTTREVHRDGVSVEPAGLAPGTMIDHFRVLRPVGRGGEGIVYLARDTSLGRLVALKLLRQRDATAQAQLLAEAQATARFSHPHIVTIYAVGTYQERPYLALEYLEGPSLRSRISERSIAPREAMRIGAAIADALAEAHRHKVLHRDLKPENVLIPSDGRVRVVDFGLAQLAELPSASSEEPLRGTPAYLAPEQCRGEPTSERADLWALGVLLHEMASGERPYSEASGLKDLLARVSSPGPVPRLDEIAPPLAELIVRCLAKDPADRPPASEVAERLRELLAAGRPGAGAADLTPFRGLEPFGERHAALFHGRDRELATFLERLREHPVLPVVGPSGAGKSSFVHAGVIPRLREQGRWAVIRLRPGSDPFRVLAARLELAASGEAELETAEQPLEATVNADPVLAARLLESPALLGSHLEQLAGELGCRVILVVDQLEELATHVAEEPTRRAFMEALSTAAEDARGSVRVIFTLREDFLSRLAVTPRVRQALGQVTLLGAPDETALEEILTAPLRELGYEYEDPRLVREMVEAAGSEAASLPLLEFTALRLWEKRDVAQRRLTRAAYDAIGGVPGALASHADGVIEGLVSSDEACARELFLRLVTPERLRRVVPVPQLLTGLPPSAEQVLDQLVRARLVSTRKSREAEGAPVAELVHESLVRHWSRLAHWIDRSREDLSFLEEVGQAAELWDRRGRRPDDLWQGETLRQGLHTLRRCTTIVIPERVRRFLAEGEAREQRARRRRRTLGAVAAAVLAVLFAVLAYQKEQADRQRIETRLRWAEAQREGARAALARGDLLESRAKLRGALETRDSLHARALWRKVERDPLIWSLELGVPVYSVAVSPAGSIVAVGRGQVAVIDPATRAHRVLRVAPEQTVAVATAPRGSAVALGTLSGEVILTDLDGSASKRLGRHRAGIASIVFSHDGSRLASGSHDGEVRFQDLRDRTKPTLTIQVGEQIGSLAFDPNGVLTLATRDRLRRFRPVCAQRRCALEQFDELTESGCGFLRHAISRDGALTAIGCRGGGTRTRSAAGSAKLQGSSDTVAQIAVSADGGRIAAEEEGGRILVWRIAEPSIERVLDGHAGQLGGLAFLPGGELVTAGYDGMVRLWSLRGPARTAPDRGHSGSVVGVVFLTAPARSTSAAELASVGADGRLRLWETRSGRERVALPVSAEALKDLAVRPDAALLAVAGGPDSIWTYDESRRLRLRKLAAQSQAMAVAISASGLVASGGRGGTIQLRDVESGEVKRNLIGHKHVTFTLAFNRDGTRLASASQDNTVRIWDPHTDAPPRVLAHERAVHGVAWSPDGESIASSSADGTVRIWNRRGEGRIVDRIAGRAYRLAFHPRIAGLLGVGTSLGRAVLLDLGPAMTAAPPSGVNPLEPPDLASEKKRWLRGHKGDVNSICFSPDGTLAATAGDDYTVRLFAVANGRSVWRGPALLASPPRLLSHLGWRRLDGQAPNAAPAISSCRRALEERAAHADQAPDRRTLCLRTLEGELELWDQDADRLLHRETIPGLREVVAIEGGCLALDASEARLYRGVSLVRRLAASAAARDRRRGRVLVVSGAQLLVLDAATGVEAARHRVSSGVRALARVGERIALGFEDGSIELLGNAASFEEVPSSAVRRLLEGPRGTLAVGYANGWVGLWHLETGARLDAVKLHGPVVHLLLEKDALYAASELGDSERLDLSILSLDYCTLVRRIQREVPVVWEGGQPVVRAPTPVPGCPRAMK